MKNKKGFTLAELLAVITILGVIALIVFPAVNKAIKNSKEKSYNQQVESILESAENWTLENMSSLSDISDNYITIGELQQSGYLEAKKVINPKTDEEMNGCIVIKYDNSYNQYTYQYNETSCDELKPKVCSTVIMGKDITTGEVVCNDPDMNARYVGEDPDNYVSFNGELWRIIGDFDGQAKIISVNRYNDECIVAWDTYDEDLDEERTNNWVKSSLKDELNGDYLSSMDETSKSYIDQNYLWKLGGASTDELTRSQFYEAERSINVYDGYPTTWNGAVGLIYPSDYGYSTSSTDVLCDSGDMPDWGDLRDTVNCYYMAWLFYSGGEWTMTSNNSNMEDVFIAYSVSGVVSMSLDIASSDQSDCLRAFPVVYLKPNVKIVDGKGTEDEPYQLQLISE